MILYIRIFFLSARGRGGSAEDSVIAVFDILYRLIDMRGRKFLLRFTYGQSADTLENVVSTECYASHIHQGPSYRDKSIYIDV